MTPDTLVPWGSAHPLAIPQQMLARIKSAIEEGREVAVLACVVELNERGNYVYTATSSTMKAEVALMAVHQMDVHVLTLMDAL
jgi:hypothetical protein